MVRYAKPQSLDDAFALLSEGRWRILAGGTDFYPALGAKPLRDDVLDINGLAELRGITETATHLTIGARTTWTDIVRADLPPALDALKAAAREVGSIQIQNAGTVAGTILSVLRVRKASRTGRPGCALEKHRSHDRPRAFRRNGHGRQADEPPPSRDQLRCD